jgi:queuine tRNA-ribosyltransferase
VLKGIGWDEAQEAGHRVILVNAYHLYLTPGLEVIKKFGGIHRFCGWQGPVLCDSGGFQAFSLNLKIGDSGLRFCSHLDGREHRFTPEKVWEINQVLGSDMVMPLDDCPPASVELRVSRTGSSEKAGRERVEKAVERTNRWLLRILDCRMSSPRGCGDQEQGKPLLFGIVQGGVYRDLRAKSARFVSQLYGEGKIDGIAVGGVAVGESKEDIRKVVRWMGEMLPEKAPKYLMGIGEPEDIEYAVSQGFDIFDSVLPTRLGRHGRIYQIGKDGRRKIKFERIDLTKGEYKTDKRWGYLHYLLKLREMQGVRYASLHNLKVYGKMMEDLQRKIGGGKLGRRELKN